MGMVGMLAAVALSFARADEGAGEAPDADLGRAVEVPQLSRAQMKFLEPRHSRLDANARGQTDFTAYTLEWGEVKIGLASVSVGALPRLQLTTVPLLDVAHSVEAAVHLRADPGEPRLVLRLGVDGNAEQVLVVLRPGAVHGTSLATAIVAHAPHLPRVRRARPGYRTHDDDVGIYFECFLVERFLVAAITPVLLVADNVVDP